MLDRPARTQPSAWEVTMFEALSSIAYEFHAEPITQLGVSRSAVERIRAALREFSRIYPDWCAMRGKMHMEKRSFT